MLLNLDERMCPEHVLDILCETDEDETIIKEFLSNFSSSDDFARIIVAPLKRGGICLWVE